MIYSVDSTLTLVDCKTVYRQNKHTEKIGAVMFAHFEAKYSNDESIAV